MLARFSAVLIATGLALATPASACPSDTHSPAAVLHEEAAGSLLMITASDPLLNLGMPLPALPLALSSGEFRPTRQDIRTAALDPDRFLRFESEATAFGIAQDRIGADEPSWAELQTEREEEIRAAALDPDRFLRFENETPSLAADDLGSPEELVTGSIASGSPERLLRSPAFQAASITAGILNLEYWAEMRASYEAQLTP